MIRPGEKTKLCLRVEKWSKSVFLPLLRRVNPAEPVGGKSVILHEPSSGWLIF
jgi:hypothetical protein